MDGESYRVFVLPVVDNGMFGMDTFSYGWGEVEGHFGSGNLSFIVIG